MVRHYNSFGGLGLIDRISQESHTSLMLLVELVKSQHLSVEKNPMEICYSILSGKGILQRDSRPQGGKNKLYVLTLDHAIVVHVHIGSDGENLSVRQAPAHHRQAQWDESSGSASCQRIPDGGLMRIESSLSDGKIALQDFY